MNSLFAVNVERYIIIMKLLHFDIIVTKCGVAFGIISIQTVSVLSGFFLTFGPNKSIVYHSEYNACITADISTFSRDSMNFSGNDL